MALMFYKYNHGYHEADVIVMKQKRTICSICFSGTAEAFPNLQPRKHLNKHFWRPTVKTSFARWIIILILIQFVTCPLIACFSSNRTHASPKSIGRFPKSLLHIEEEAFEGTAFKTLIFEEGFLSAADRAFGGMTSLVDAYFPNTTEYIADSTFEQSSLKRIIGEEGTYIQKWAKQHNIEYEPDECYLTLPFRLYISKEVLLSLLALFRLPPDVELKKRKNNFNKYILSMRPQDRPELNPIDYRFP